MRLAISSAAGDLYQDPDNTDPVLNELLRYLFGGQHPVGVEGNSDLAIVYQ